MSIGAPLPGVVFPRLWLGIPNTFMQVFCFLGSLLVPGSLAFSLVVIGSLLGYLVLSLAHGSLAPSLVPWFSPWVLGLTSCPGSVVPEDPGGALLPVEEGGGVEGEVGGEVGGGEVQRRCSGPYLERCGRGCRCGGGGGI